MADDLENLRGVLLGLGLNSLPKLLTALHKARAMGNNVEARRAPDDHGDGRVGGKAQSQAPGAGPGDMESLQSMLAPLLAQMGGQGGQAPMPVNTPGMRPGMPPAPLPRMGSLPRTVEASSGVF